MTEMGLDKTAPVSTPCIPPHDISEHGNINQTALPIIRMILVGEASLECLDSLILAIDSPIKNWLPQDILYLNAGGKLEVCPAETNRNRTGRVADGWQASEQALNNLAETTKTFKEAEPEITRFLHDCDWLLFVVALDSPMAFVAGESISSIARDAGVMSVAVVGTPYLDNLVEADCSWKHSEALSVATIDVVESMSAICHCVIPDNGFWGFGDQPMNWGFYQSTYAPGLISEMANRKSCCTQIGDAIATSGVCMVGCNYSEFEQPKAAIEDAISEIESSYWLGNEIQLVSSGAILHIIGNEDRVEQMKQGVSLALCEPSKILRNGKTFWADDANFHIMTSAPEYMREEDFCFIQILSMGVVEV